MARVCGHVYKFVLFGVELLVYMYGSIPLIKFY